MQRKTLPIRQEQREPDSASLLAALVPADRENAPNWWLWLVFLIAALLFHAAVLFFVKIDWPAPLPPPPVEIQQVDPRKLEAIRKQWRNQPQQLLLDRDKAAPREKEAPPDARYMSDRNIRVKKEQRAREHTLLPQPGGPQAPAKPRPEVRPRIQHALPSLGNLGVPLRLDEQPRRAERENSRQGPGGEQYIDDSKVPEGGENLLNAQESIYYSFYARLYETIGPIWRSGISPAMVRKRPQPGDYTTVVDVVFDQMGNLLEVRRIHGSGIPEFDEVVDQSWKKVGRFPNPPAGLLNPQGHVHTGWTFTVKVSSGMGLQYLPPERAY